MARVMACAPAIERIKWIRLTNRGIMQQNLFQNFLPQEAAAFGNKVEKEPQKPRPKLKKYVYYTFTKNISSACNPRPVVIFCINILIL